MSKPIHINLINIIKVDDISLRAQVIPSGKTYIVTCAAHHQQKIRDAARIEWAPRTSYKTEGAAKFTQILLLPPTEFHNLHVDYIQFYCEAFLRITLSNLSEFSTPNAEYMPPIEILIMAPNEDVTELQSITLNHYHLHSNTECIFERFIDDSLARSRTKRRIVLSGSGHALDRLDLSRGQLLRLNSTIHYLPKDWVVYRFRRDAGANYNKWSLGLEQIVNANEEGEDGL